MMVRSMFACHDLWDLWDLWEENMYRRLPKQQL
jgi:hypothetical protein